ncbi:unnamed protein product [Didymodactylos carnosus]|uniref:Uncharacterized protein n=1 Tax=Didymodactylos carnosus TaxID=1234261 RepID=A0A8S2DDD6_9BILA|nr:unnamed protein product [Didymodactylos carnosus]CAF3691107.1 unnamed protein product [Didymodactylos carnosus]
MLNAIIGNDLLPSRTTAMTRLPTEIIFKQDLTEPQLTLDIELVHAFEVICGKIKLKVTENSGNILIENLDYQDHLYDTVHIIVQGTMPKIENITHNQEQIAKLLIFINDAIRTSNMLEIDNSIIKDHVPRIDVPISSRIKNDTTTTVQIFPYEDNLIIADTPGPTEQCLSNHLKEVISKELKKAVLVMIVFDFSNLNSRAKHEITNEVNNIHDNILFGAGRNTNQTDNSLYALVNKVDQHVDDKDMSHAQKKKWIVTKFKTDDQKVYETFSKNAMVVRSFLTEYEQTLNKQEQQSRITTHQILEGEIKIYKQFIKHSGRRMS